MDSLIEALNNLLSREYAAIRQYYLHKYAGKNLGLEKYSDYVSERYHDEKRHVKILIKLIFEIGGVPTAMTDKVTVSVDNPEAQLNFDEKSEIQAISDTNKVIGLAADMGQESVVTVLRKIVKDETEHLADIRTRKGIIRRIGADVWESTQVSD